MIEIRPGMSATYYVIDGLRAVEEELSKPDLSPEEKLKAVIRKAVLEGASALANHLGQVMPVETFADRIEKSVSRATLEVSALFSIRPGMEPSDSGIIGSTAEAQSFQLGEN